MGPRVEANQIWALNRALNRYFAASYNPKDNIHKRFPQIESLHSYKEEAELNEVRMREKFNKMLLEMKALRKEKTELQLVGLQQV